MPLTILRKSFSMRRQNNGVRCNRMALGNFDSSGRRKAIGEKDTFIVECNQVILA